MPGPVVVLGVLTVIALIVLVLAAGATGRTEGLPAKKYVAKPVLDPAHVKYGISTKKRSEIQAYLLTSSSTNVWDARRTPPLKGTTNKSLRAPQTVYERQLIAYIQHQADYLMGKLWEFAGKGKLSTGEKMLISNIRKGWGGKRYVTIDGRADQGSCILGSTSKADDGQLVLGLSPKLTLAYALNTMCHELAHMGTYYEPKAHNANHTTSWRWLVLFGLRELKWPFVEFNWANACTNFNICSIGDFDSKRVYSSVPMTRSLIHKGWGKPEDDFRSNSIADKRPANATTSFAVTGATSTSVFIAVPSSVPLPYRVALRRNSDKQIVKKWTPISKTRTFEFTNLAPGTEYTVYVSDANGRSTASKVQKTLGASVRRRTVVNPVWRKLVPRRGRSGPILKGIQNRADVLTGKRRAMRLRTTTSTTDFDKAINTLGEPIFEDDFASGGLSTSWTAVTEANGAKEGKEIQVFRSAMVAVATTPYGTTAMDITVKPDTTISGYKYASGKAVLNVAVKNGAVRFLAMLPSAPGLMPRLQLFPVVNGKYYALEPGGYPGWPSAGKIGVAETRGDEIDTVHQKVVASPAGKVGKSVDKETTTSNGDKNFATEIVAYGAAFDATGVRFYIADKLIDMFEWGKDTDINPYALAGFEGFSPVISLGIGGFAMKGPPDQSNPTLATMPHMLVQKVQLWNSSFSTNPLAEFCNFLSSLNGIQTSALTDLTSMCQLQVSGATSNSITIAVAKEFHPYKVYMTRKNPKRGLGSREAPSMPALVEKLGVSWMYNWMPSSGVVPANVEYVAMKSGMWWPSLDQIKVKGGGAVLMYNEPNHAGMANMNGSILTPIYAASEWGKFEAFLAKNPGVRLGAPCPAINGEEGAAYRDPMPWLDEYIAALPAGAWDKISFTTIHKYGNSFDELAKYVDLMWTKYQKPVWITEFAGQGEPEVHYALMQQALPWLDAHPHVERYAWFPDPALWLGGKEGTGHALMDSAGNLTALGNLYVNNDWIVQDWTSPVSSSTYTFGNLTPDTEYSITVQANNRDVTVKYRTSPKWVSSTIVA